MARRMLLRGRPIERAGWAAVISSAPAPEPRLRPGGVFVGRDAETAELLAGLDDAIAGRGSLFLVTGDPGVGKSRLVDELSERAPARGARVLWGRCWEGGGAPAYWPWIQVLRALIREIDTESVAALMGGGAADIAQMVRELYERLPNLPVPTAADSERARFSLFDSTTSFLKNVAAAQPLLVIIDDLNGADLPSLLLLQFLAGELRDARMMIAGIFRDGEVRRRPQVAHVLGELVGRAHRVPLAGLSEAEVARFIERAWGHVPSPDLAAAVHRKTEGNPFFVDEVLRLLRAEGAPERAELAAKGELGIPESVRQAIRRRLEVVPQGVEHALSVAAVIGREFNLSLLEVACEVSQDELLERLGEAGAGGILVEMPSVPGRFAFSHGLIRETLYDDLTPARRRQIHRRVAEALEGMHHTHPEPHVPELAHHFFQALPVGDVDKAIEYAARAGARALAQLAYEEAVEDFERALQALSLKGTPDEAARCELLLSLATALRRAGETAEAKQVFVRAAECARILGAPEQLARAALGYGGELAEEGVGLPGSIDETLVCLLEEALEALPPADGALRARVLARLSVGISWRATQDRVASLSRRAVEMAQPTGDPAALTAAVYSMRYALWGPDDLGERVAATDEIARLAVASGDRERRLQGMRWRVSDLLEIGDVAGVDREIEAHERLARELRQPLYLWHTELLRAMQAMMRGRVAEAERRTERALEAGRRAQSPFADVLHAAQMTEIWRLQGRLGGVEPAFRRYVEQFPEFPIVRAAHAGVLCELGRLDEARAELERLAAHGFDDIRRDHVWLACLRYVAIVCAALGDATRAAHLAAMLAPYAGRGIVTGLPACVWLGTVDLLLGRLAATAGDLEAAAGHFEAAIAFGEANALRAFTAEAQEAYARVLVERGGWGDRKRALDLLAPALATSRECGIALAGRIERLLGESPVGEPARAPAPGEPARAPASGEPAPAAAAGNVFRREGEYWTVAYEGAVLRLRDSKGMGYLAHLLARPGEELHSAELAAGTAGRAAQRPPVDRQDLLAVGFGDAGEMLDGRAKAAYRSKLSSLEHEVDEAEAWGDAERAAKARAEIDTITQELARAVGLGGRDRRAASEAERARVNVTRAVKAAVERIALASPELGRHLAATVKTGTFCVYAPDPRARIAWSF